MTFVRSDKFKYRPSCHSCVRKGRKRANSETVTRILKKTARTAKTVLASQGDIELSLTP